MENASAGDNEATLVLTYSDGVYWYQSREDVSFHVNNFFEEYQAIMAIVAIVSSLLALVSLPRTYKWIKRKRFPEKSTDLADEVKRLADVNNKLAETIEQYFIKDEETEIKN